MKITFGVDVRGSHIKNLAQGTRKRMPVASLRFAAFVVAIMVCLLMPRPGSAQSIISGEITGAVTDATNAVVPNATVTLMSTESGFTATTTTNSSGSFRFPLLRPGTYNLSVTANSFRTSKRDVVAAVGQVVDVTVQLEVGATTETVEVTATQPVLDTENANLTTTYSPAQIENIPNPGGDLTNYALSAPGVVLSTGAGYGNFTAHGLPGESNLFTINGGDMNDPYNGLNNSGSSNNMLGVNEVQEVAIVSNGYTGQYGRAASLNVNFTTKSGSNSFHGNAKWDWNGRYLNANDWFNNATGTPRPFANSNEWGGSIGGPIVKNKLFFFYDNEGLRYVLPGGGPVYVPTAAWAAAVQANINATQPAESAFYQSMFNLYAGAQGAGAATALSVDDPTLVGGCGDFAGSALGGVTFGAPGGQACTKTFRTTVTNLNRERLQSVRVDFEVSSKDHISGRYWQDRGRQPTFTDPINPAFNSLSIQPQDTGQLTETHSFSTNLVNQLIISGSYYSAIFGPANFAAATAVFPTTIGEAVGGNSCYLADGNLSCMGGELYRYPQGRNVSQYQLVDDLSWTKGNHGLKFGINFKRVDLADHQPSSNHSGQLRIRSITDFVNGVMMCATCAPTGGASSLRQRFSTGQDFQISNYSVGFYGQDEWRVKSNLKLTMSLRLDRNANETCKTNCFSSFNGGFQGISHNSNTPYNQSVLLGQSSIFPTMERIVWEPRGGFAWTPTKNTVVRGGIGIFSDLYAAEISSDVLANPPTVTSWTITPTTTNLPIAPGVPGGVFAQAAANNAAVASQIATGGTFASMQAAAGPAFSGPTFFATPQHMLNPKYTEWNLEIQHAIGSKLVASVNYIGNHGTDELLIVSGENAFTTAAGGFDNLPVGAAPDPRFTIVTQLTNSGISNYNGVTASLTSKATKGFSASLAYTYSHSLDNISNGGLDQYSTNQLGDSLRYQVDPQNLRRLNYGSSDYDFRHVFNVNYVWEVPFLSSNRVLGGWIVSGTLIKRSGEPYSVVTTAPGTVQNYNASGALILVDYNGGAIPGCTVSSDQVNSPFTCLPTGNFAAARTNFGNVPRNSFRGPGFFDTDLSIKKSFRVTKNESGLRLILGANAYNVLNHRNFGNPDNFRRSGTFGTIQNTVTPASSPYGNFQGAAVSGRILQLEMEVKF
jgi:Carboxypeptidase regulatory-like domain